MKFNRTLLLVLFSVSQPFIALAAAPCAAIGDADRGRLADYVQKKYKLPLSARLDIQELSFVEESCYRRMQFTSANTARPFNMEFVASPDLRFLTRELLDSHADPIEKARRDAQLVVAKLARGDAAALGPNTAPVTMVLFSDFQCPFCSQMAHGLMKEILPAEGDNVRLIFRNYPLSMHPWARAAAEATACARVQNEKYFWKLHDYLFDRQHDLTIENLEPVLSAQAATLDGFDTVRFRNCIDKHESAAAVDLDMALGREMQVSGTPTLFVNGQRVSGYQADQIRTLIRELSAPAGEQSPETRR